MTIEKTQMLNRRISLNAIIHKTGTKYGATLVSK